MKKLLASLFITLLLAIPVLAQTEGVEAPPEAMATDSFTIKPYQANKIKPAHVLLEMKPGDKTEFEFVVTNKSGVPFDLSVYPADGIYTNKGTKTITGQYDAHSEIGKWIKINKEKISTNPGSQEKIKATVTIPPETKIGTYFGGLAAEKLNKEEGKSIQIALRIALPVQIKVTPDPQEIPMYDPPQSVPTNFFWSTLAIFLISAGYIGMSKIKENKAKNKK